MSSLCIGPPVFVFSSANPLCTIHCKQIALHPHPAVPCYIYQSPHVQEKWHRAAKLQHAARALLNTRLRQAWRSWQEFVAEHAQRRSRLAVACSRWRAATLGAAFSAWAGRAAELKQERQQLLGVLHWWQGQLLAKAFKWVGVCQHHVLASVLGGSFCQGAGGYTF